MGRSVGTVHMSFVRSFVRSVSRHCHWFVRSQYLVYSPIGLKWCYSLSLLYIYRRRLNRSVYSDSGNYGRQKEIASLAFYTIELCPRSKLGLANFLQIFNSSPERNATF